MFDTASKDLATRAPVINPPILLRRDGTQLQLNAGGIVLGLFADAEYEETEIELSTDDQLVLFTDGVTEAVNAAQGRNSAKAGSLP